MAAAGRGERRDPAHIADPAIARAAQAVDLRRDSEDALAGCRIRDAETARRRHRDGELALAELEAMIAGPIEARQHAPPFRCPRRARRLAPSHPRSGASPSRDVRAQRAIRALRRSVSSPAAAGRPRRPAPRVAHGSGAARPRCGKAGRTSRAGCARSRPAPDGPRLSGRSIRARCRPSRPASATHRRSPFSPHAAGSEPPAAAR